MPDFSPASACEASLPMFNFVEFAKFRSADPGYAPSTNGPDDLCLDLALDQNKTGTTFKAVPVLLLFELSMPHSLLQRFD